MIYIFRKMLYFHCFFFGFPEFLSNHLLVLCFIVLIRLQVLSEISKPEKGRLF